MTLRASDGKNKKCPKSDDQKNAQWVFNSVTFSKVIVLNENCVRCSKNKRGLSERDEEEQVF